MEKSSTSTQLRNATSAYSALHMLFELYTDHKTLSTCIVLHLVSISDLVSCFKLLNAFCNELCTGTNVQSLSVASLAIGGAAESILARVLRVFSAYINLHT